MDLKLIENLVMPYLEEQNLKLYSIEMVREYGYNILRVAVDKDGGIDVDSLALVNEYLSLKIDGLDNDLDEYLLEVCSPGAEKELRNEKEILDAIGSYVHVKTKDMVYEGNLIAFTNNTIELKINVKGRMQKVDVDYSDVKKIRLAVKI